MAIQTIKTIAGDVLYAYRHDRDPTAPNALRDAVLAAASKGVSLAGADLGGVDLSGARLPAMDFTGACLFGADFRHTDLTACRFSGADIRYANFKGAMLVDVRLDGANTLEAIGVRRAMRGRR